MKRYTVFWVPLSYGYPYNTDSWTMAWIITQWRQLFCWGDCPCKAVIVDNLNDEAPGSMHWRYLNWRAK